MALGVSLFQGGASQELQEPYDRDELFRMALAEIASHGNHTCLTVSSCCEGSRWTFSDVIWEAVKGWAEKWHIREILDSTPRMLERYYTFYNLFDNMRQSDAHELFLADCYFGVAAILLNAVPAVEFEDGLKLAQDMFVQARKMLLRNNATEQVNWTLPLEPIDVMFPFYLGLRPNNCHGSKLKVFVYDTANYSAGSIFCSAGQWGVEVMIHRYFSSSACRTLDPEEADLFFVPDYRACHFHLAPTYQHKGLTRLPGDDYHSQIIRNHAQKYRRWDQADELFRQLIGSLEYFPRKRGIDHVFVFSDQGFIVNFTHTFPSWRDVMPHSIILSTEAFTPGCGPSCFSPWKDIVIPGHIDWDRQREIRKWSKPSSERTLLFNFHGRMPGNHEYYEKNAVRGALERFAGMPGVSVGGFIEDYFEVMGSSHFCLVPEGTSSWTNHLYESFLAGCIPFLLSDNYVLPFQDLINWSSLSVRWPQHQVDETMLLYIVDLVQNRRDLVERMKARVDEAACWFDFYAFDDDCSPYRGILHALEQRSQTMPPYLHPSGWLAS